MTKQTKERILKVEQEKIHLKPIVYARMFADLKVIANDCGYALTLHGSLVSDGDMVAIPWVDACEEPETLIQKFCDELKGFIPEDGGGPEEKPHNRVAWCLLFMGGPYKLDISVVRPIEVSE